MMQIVESFSLMFFQQFQWTRSRNNHDNSDLNDGVIFFRVFQEFRWNRSRIYRANALITAINVEFSIAIQWAIFNGASPPSGRVKFVKRRRRRGSRMTGTRRRSDRFRYWPVYIPLKIQYCSALLLCYRFVGSIRFIRVYVHTANRTTCIETSSEPLSKSGCHS